MASAPEPGIGRARGSPGRRAERDEHGCLLVQPLAEAPQLRETLRAGKTVLPGLVGNLERKNLVLPPARQRRKAIDERLA